MDTDESVQPQGIIEVEQDKLGLELQTLRQKLALGQELSVRWVPTVQGKLSGEVKGTCIFIYEVDEEKALETLNTSVSRLQPGSSFNFSKNRIPRPETGETV
ncbi:MAG: hypothetical protein ACLFU9_06795 [Candidatus Bathyarchaeia archaeon]